MTEQPAKTLEELRPYLTEDEFKRCRAIAEEYDDGEEEFLALAWERADARSEDDFGDWMDEDDEREEMLRWHAGLAITRVTSLEEQMKRLEEDDA